MSFVYKLKNIDTEKYKELGFEPLPEEICAAPDNQNFWFKVVLQETNSEPVLSLIDYYNRIADKICSDVKLRAAHAKIGIKFRKKKGKHYLVLNHDLRMMFRAWRIELDLENEDVYFTISDQNIPCFYDADMVLDRYCDEAIKELLVNDLIYREEVKPVQ